jgi:RuvB C-terminal winged helix domain
LSARPRAPACSPIRCATASAFRYGLIFIPTRSSSRSSIAAPAFSASSSPLTAQTRSPAARAARHASQAIDRAVADKALAALEVDAAGLDAMDRRYLTTIAVNYGGGPVGVETLAAALSEPRDAIEDIIEPYLIQCGLLQRTPRGRLITGHAFRHLGLIEPARDPAQFGLFSSDEET